MRKDGLKAKTIRKFKATTNSDHNLPVAENLLDRDFSPAAPNKAWVADITYICGMSRGTLFSRFSNFSTLTCLATSPAAPPLILYDSNPISTSERATLRQELSTFCA